METAVFDRGIGIEDRAMRTGRAGENIAEVFLRGKGYVLLKKNFMCKRGEIDLIVAKDNLLIFVEVKTRNSLKYGLPSEAVTPSKIKHIKSAAEWYISLNKPNMKPVWNHCSEYRFDVVEILRLNNKQYIKHTENAF